MHQNVAFSGKKMCPLPSPHLAELRSTMHEDQLNGLSHLYINRDVEPDYRALLRSLRSLIVVCRLCKGGRAILIKMLIITVLAMFLWFLR